MFLFYVWLGALFNTTLNWDYFVSNFSELSGKSLLITFMPLFAWILGFLSVKQFFFVFTNSICFILCLLMFVYFGINFRMALNGQTWRENAKNVRAYDMGWRFNLRQVLGRRWLAAALNPFAESTLPTNGTTFAKRDDNDDNDDPNSQSGRSPFNVPKRRII